MKKALVALAALVALPACTVAATTEQAASTPEGDVLTNYADLAHAKYEDSLITARALQGAVNRLVAEPTEENLAAAKDAWLAARVPYQQSEVYRFGNAIVDDWEGKVNAWPLDEGLIDYVAASYGTESEENPGYTANVVASSSFTFSGESIDASAITKELLGETLHELGGVEANVATGYHAVEFLLWGQDLNGTGPGAGARPASDFDTADCTAGNCERRAAYLQTATDLLIDDLEWMTAQWASGGEAREGLVGGDASEGIATIFTGMGSLSYGELAGERMQLGLLLHDPEEEHDCFSDNTHASHYYDALGIQNIYLGTYERIDGSVVDGPSVSDLVAAVLFPRLADRRFAGLFRAAARRISHAVWSLSEGREGVGGCRPAVGASSRYAAPSLRYGPSGDPPPSARLSASMAVSGAFGHGPIARRLVVAGA